MIFLFLFLLFLSFSPFLKKIPFRRERTLFVLDFLQDKKTKEGGKEGEEGCCLGS